MQRLVLNASAANWVQSYVPAGGACCDLIFYRLKMSRRERNNASYQTDWALEVQAMPADLVLLARALIGYPGDLLHKYLPVCTQ